MVCKCQSDTMAPQNVLKNSCIAVTRNYLTKKLLPLMTTTRRASRGFPKRVGKLSAKDTEIVITSLLNVWIACCLCAVRSISVNFCNDHYRSHVSRVRDTKYMKCSSSRTHAIEYLSSFSISRSSPQSSSCTHPTTVLTTLRSRTYWISTFSACTHRGYACADRIVLPVGTIASQLCSIMVRYMVPNIDDAPTTLS